MKSAKMGNCRSQDDGDDEGSNELPPAGVVDSEDEEEAILLSGTLLGELGVKTLLDRPEVESFSIFGRPLPRNMGKMAMAVITITMCSAVTLTERCCRRRDALSSFDPFRSSTVTVRGDVTCHCPFRRPIRRKMQRCLPGVSFFCLITRSEVPFSRFPVNHQNQSPSISSSSPANAIGTFGSIRFILPSMNGVSSDSD